MTLPLVIVGAVVILRGILALGAIFCKRASAVEGGRAPLGGRVLAADRSGHHSFHFITGRS